MDIEWQSKVKAWATSKTTDKWITDKSAGKKVMLFLADDDREYDNVFLTTEDNIGYKLGFAMGEEKQLLAAPKQFFRNQQVSVDNLRDRNYEDFR
jgi:hypothetical protein